MSGVTLQLNNDQNILAINSPKDRVGGPYKVVYKDTVDRWAIVALDWEGKPTLGIRWFWGNGGNPFSSGHPIWLVIPSQLLHTTLTGLPLAYGFRKKIEDFLAGKISGSQL
ncbi:MAG: hypothetical protein AAF399_10650 [Bacteroidota bacterium]